MNIAKEFRSALTYSIIIVSEICFAGVIPETQEKKLELGGS